MAESVKISKLPPVGVGTFGPEDQFIVNDVSTGVDGVTSLITVGSFIGWFTSKDLQFTGTIELGNVIPASTGLNMTVDGIHVLDKISFDPLADITGIHLTNLEDVTIDSPLLEHGHLLMWDSQQSTWVNDYLNTDNANDTVSAQFDLLRDSIQMLQDSIEDILDNQLLSPPGNDGGYYVMQNGQWVDVTSLLLPFTQYLVYDGGVAPGGDTPDTN